MFVDSHCHLELEEYDDDRAAVVGRALDAGVSWMLTVGTEERYFPKVIEISEANPRVFGAIGIHPHNAADYSDALEERIKGYLAHPGIVGYGEIGLDFYRDYAPRDAQTRAFGRQIEIARAANLPIIIHSRNARDETLDILKNAGLRDHKTVIHCYSYDLDTARKMLDLGFFLSIPGTVTYKNSALGEVIHYVPVDRLLSETDAPFLTPRPNRGKRNEPAFVKLVAEEIARIKETAVEEVAPVLAETFRRIFLTAEETTI
jgi:TatD DNase family protein